MPIIPILIIIVVILFLKNAMSSNKSVGLTTKTSVVTSSCTSSGDNFCQGAGIVAGVKEPLKPLVCNPLRGCDVNPMTPIHLSFPVDPPPIAIQKKVPVAPTPIHCCHIGVGIFTCDARNITTPPIQKKTVAAAPRIYQGQSGTKYRIFPGGGIGNVNACCSVFPGCGR